MRKTLRSLWTSAIALTLCVSMLLGTTFAWFTDSVSSDRNIIAAGNLDVELEYLKGDSWKPVREDTNVFKDAKWEPGYTEVVYLRVSNLGSLALKYMLSVKIASEIASINVNGESFRLSEFIKIGAVDGVSTPYSDRGVAQKAVESSARGLRDGYTKTSRLEEGDVAYVALVLYMPESVGNEANRAKGEAVPKIDLGLNLVATQADSETDGFGNGDYDANAGFPALTLPGAINKPVEKDAQGKLLSDTVIEDSEGKVKAEIPAGIPLAEGVDTLSLLVKEMESSGANLTLADNEILRSLNVHIEGIADGNTTPTIITVKEALMPGLNLGNLKLVHVEDGVNKEMVRVNTLADLDAHNEFVYDPATGDITLAMASFSEVALVADSAKAWEGNRDYSWYTNAVAPLAEGEPDYVIANADQLAAFGAIVGGMDGQTQDSFAGKTVKLIADVNLGDKESENNPDVIFYPIGYWNNEETYERKPLEERTTAVESGFYSFEGTFDGNGHTIANFYQNTWEMKGDHNWYDPIKEQYYRDGMGLFGRIYKGTVKNLTVKNFSSDGEITTTGTIAAYAEGATFENIAIFNCNPRVYNIGNGGIVGCVGWYAKEAGLKTTFTNITVDNSNKISALWGSYDVACGGIVGQYYPTSGQTSAGTPKNGGIEFVNCHISAQMDVYNDVCANYQYYAYRYAGILLGSVRENVTIDGHVYPKMDGITANGCTVHFGDWNDYYYCEIIDNTTASYTHDYQMSRLVQVKAVNVANMTVTDLEGNTTAIPTSGRVNYVVVKAKDADGKWIHGDGHGYAECYHFKDGEVWNHEDAGYHNGENGEKYIDENKDGVADLKEDKQLVYREFNNLVTGYGWGVTSKGVDDMEGVTILDRIEGNSVEKFTGKVNELDNNKEYTLGDIFNFVDNGVELVPSALTVSISNLAETNPVSATIKYDRDNWANSTITFAGTGDITITIQDYYFCTPTTITVNVKEREAVEKFTAKDVIKDAYTSITLGDLFEKNGVDIVGNITAIINDPDKNDTTLTGTEDDFASLSVSLIKDGEYTITLKDEDKYCEVATAKITVNKVDKFTKKFDKDFLYRVGNAANSPVALGTLFEEIGSGAQSVSAKIETIAGDANGTFTSNATWTDGKIQFSGTGVVKVTISADGANAVELNLEVVNATNITSATGTTTGGDMVLLQDVKTTNYVNYWNCTLWGNGFTYSLEGAPTAYNSKQGHGVLITKNATLDNLVIVGDVYNSYGAYTNQDFYNAAIDVLGDTTIQNCYISGCAAPVSTRASVTIIDTTLYGGTVANLLIKSGVVTLENVTTANYDDGRSLVGMGVVIHSDATAATKLILKGKLTQYNFISESKTPSDSNAKILYNAMFDASCSEYHFGTSPNRYVNAGIISMTSVFGESNIVDNANTGYVGSSVTVNKIDGYVYTQLKTDGTVNNNYDKENDSHIANTQGPVAPTYSFDYTNKNYQAKQDGSNDYCYEENGIVYISMDKGDIFNWNTSILTATKLGQTLSYTVSMNGVDYTGKSIAFTTADSYEVVYSYTDDSNYGLDAEGKIITYSKTYTKTVYITVAVVESAQKNAEINVTQTAMSGIYVMSGDYDYSYKMKFLDCITITDYDVNGNATTVALSEDIQSTSFVDVNGANPGKFDANNGTITITYNNGKILTVKIGAWSGSGPSTKTCSVKTDNGVYIITDGASNAANTGVTWKITGYTYTGNNGAIVENNTTITFTWDTNSEGYNSKSSGSCVTPDTLVTLADGTQVRVDALKGDEELLVWNHATGKLEKAPVAYIVDHEGEISNTTIVHLNFSNGKTVKMIGEHVFFDATLNKYVAITEGNAESFIGHTFLALNAEGTGVEEVALVSLSKEMAETTVYEVVSYKHLTCFTEGILSTSAYLDPLLNVFDIDEDTFAYDAESVQKDIEAYGLYTYADFEGLISEEAFELYNAAYLKIAVEKGYITWDDILDLIDIYFNAGVDPLSE